jgi:hypothetical protein
MINPAYELLVPYSAGKPAKDAKPGKPPKPPKDGRKPPP